METSHQHNDENLRPSTKTEAGSELWPLSTQQKWLFDQKKAGHIGSYNQLLCRLSPEFNQTQNLEQVLGHAFAQTMEQHEVFKLSLMHSSRYKYPQQIAQQTHSLIINTRHSSDLQLLSGNLASAKTNQQEHKPEHTLDEMLLISSAELYSAQSQKQADNRLMVDIWALGSDAFMCITVANHILDNNSLRQLCDLVDANIRTPSAEPHSTELTQADQATDITQYSQYIAWQQDLAQDEDATIAENYWQDPAFKGESDSSLLQAKHKSNTAESSLIRHRTRSFSLNVPDGMNRQATLLAAWQCLYARLSRAENVTVFASMDLRHDYDELRDSLGCFQSWVPFNTSIAADSGFNSLQAWTKQQWEQHSEWLDFFQGADIINPICFFHYQELNTHLCTSFEVGLQSQLQSTGGFMLHCIDDGTTVKLQLSMDASVLPAQWLELLLECYEYFLQASLDNLTQSVLAQPLISKEHLSGLFSNVESPSKLTRSKPIIKRFTNAVGLFPEHIALVSKTCASPSLTYQELDLASNRLAHQLTSISGNQPVLLCSERSVSMIVGLLACLKAGKPYVPLDPDQPSKRLKQVAEHTQATAMLINHGQESPDYFSGQLITIDVKQLIKQGALPEDTNYLQATQCRVPDDSLAYIIYTSGSTGEPKAVAISHHNLEHYVDSIGDALSIEEGMSYATVSTLSADLGNTAIFPALTTGGTLHVIDYACSTNGVAFRDYLDSNLIDVLKIVPSHYQALCAALPQGQSISPRAALVFGGELLAADLALQSQQEINNQRSTCRIFNHYGPTETTIGAFTLDIELAQQQGLELANHASVPIGFALGDGHFFVADPQGNVIPSGCAGELYIGGPGVSPGYLGSNEITQANNQRSFTIRDELPTQDPRYYRTGDLVRELNCGGLEFLGRTDEQVKLRGFRIELNAITHTLRQHQAVSNALVMVIDQQITAFCVTQSNAQKDSIKTELQDSANQNLPYYMVPSQWVFVARLPLTDNGKPDRKKLRTLATQSAQDIDVEPVITDTEKSLLEIWQKLLKRTTIGRNSHFFESGGHSLLATQLVFKAQTQLLVDIPLGQIFDTPILCDLAEYVDQNKQAGQTFNSIEQCPSDAQVPLTFAQQRLWFMQQLAPDSAAYNVPAVIELNGELNVAYLQRAFAALLERHSGLLARFEVNQGDVHFAASNYKAPILEPINADLFSESTLIKSIKQLISKSFDLSEEPAIRVGLYRFNSHRHQLVVVMHHIICDGWSRDVLIQDLTQAYQAYCREQEPLWAELPISYQDFAYWQSQQFNNGLDSQLSYWKVYLSEEQEALKLSAGQRRPAQQTFNGKAYEFFIDENLVSKLRGLSNEHSTTLFTTLLTAFHVLLLRYSGQPLVRIGFPIAGRNHAGLENLVGLLTNTLVTQSYNNSMSFSQLLEQQRDDMRQAFEHQDVPFETLVERLQPRRSLSHSPIFQAFFSLQPARQTGVTMDQLKLELQATAHTSSKFDVSLLIDEPAESSLLKASLEYDTALFDDVWVERFTQHYLNLLSSIVHKASEDIQCLPILTEQEQLKSVTFDAPDIDFCLLSRLQTYCNKQPSALAIVFDQTQWTYAQLDEQVTRISAGLIARGIGKSDRVVIRLERSPEMLFSLLAILRVGACFVPLDPILPIARQRYIIDQCQATLVISNPDVPELSASMAQGLWQTIDQITQKTNKQIVYKANIYDSEKLTPAYILYTSGSTGKPKGVEVGLQALNCLLDAMQTTLELDASDLWLALTSISFDISLLELLLPLGTGGAIVLTNSEQSRSPQQLADLIQQYSVTVMQATPGAWQQLLESGWKAPHKMTLLSGGEAMSTSLAAKLLPQSERLLNVYGPTEATIWASCKTIKQANQISLGQPLKHYRHYVLNEALQIQADGTVGQLAIAGPGLACGYFDKVDLTAERFVINEALGRIYLTGDLAYKNDHGELHYLGRTDDQIKWRGYRIELGEVAESVERLAQVTMAYCHLLDDQLVCFYTSNHQDNVNVDLRQDPELLAWLPSYMIPSQFLMLESLPLTTSGKVDRQSLKLHWENLKEQIFKDSALNMSDIETLSLVEQELLALWQTLLPNSKPSVNDDFFAIGGHSLLLTRLLDKIRTKFACDLALHRLFEATTIVKQAKLIELSLVEHGTVEGAEDTVELRVLGKATAPLSFAQQRLWFLDQFIGDRSAYNVPLSVKLDGVLNTLALECSLQKLLLDHPQLRTQFSLANVVNQQPTQTISTGCEVTLRRILVDPKQDLAKAISMLSQQLIALNSTPLIKAYLLSTDEQSTQQTLLLVIHHIAVDGWSLPIIYRDIINNYKELSVLSDVDLKVRRLQLIDTQHQPNNENTLQYTDFADWQHSTDFNKRLNTQLTYWRQYIGTELSTLSLPLDYPRPKQQTFNGGAVQLAITPALSQQLTALAAQNQCSLFVLLMALYSKLLSRYSGQDEVFIGTPIANRHLAGTSTICGLFANTQVYRCQHLDGQTIDDLINHVKRDSIAAQQHQDLPFEQLVNALSLDRDQSRTPLFQAMMVFQQGDISLAPMLLDELVISPASKANIRAKFDLTLTVNVVSDKSIELAFEYNSDLFKPQTMRDMMATLHAQCQAICEASDTEATKSNVLNVLSVDHRQAYEDVNNTHTPSDLKNTIVDCFSQQCQVTPAATALLFDTSNATSASRPRLSYQQLDNLTSLVAAQIRLRDTRSNPVVGLMFDRSLSMVVALLGILKAGAAYLPISPSLPQTRKAFMVSKASCDLVICQPEYAESVNSISSQSWLLSDNELIDMLGDNSGGQYLPETIPASADDTAYVIYTSGSTGEPKGVAVSHRSLINRLHWQQSLANIDHRDVVLQKTPYAFDVSVWEFLWPIMTGATLSIAKPEAHLDPSELTRLINQDKVTVMHFVPSMLQVFCDSFNTDESQQETQRLNPQLLDSLKTIICSGEALSAPLAKQALALLPDIDLYNLYGPTEAAIDVSVWHVNKVRQSNWQEASIPIGKPIANTQLYVLDEHQKQVPLGVTGELYIAGVGLANGYIGQSTLTQERFNDVTLNEQTVRMYRTGDLARWRWEQDVELTEPSLTLEYLGRTDGQIKLRGQRLELSEIETVLLQQKNIEQAVVIAYPAAQPEHLIACVVSSETSLDADLVKQHLLAQLPSYMLPSQVLVINKVPLSANGKTDRKQLYRYVELQCQNIVVDVQSDYVHTELSVGVCKTLATLLGIDNVDPSQDLFELGAHSLWMVSLQQQLAREFGVQLSLNVLFSHSKIEKLISLINEEMGAIDDHNMAETITLDSAVKHHEASDIPFVMPLANVAKPMDSAVSGVVSSEQAPTLYCIHPASGFSGPFQSIANTLSCRFNVVGINAQQALSSGHYPDTIDAIAEDYVKQIQEQHLSGDYYFLGWSLGGHIAVAMTRILEEQGEKVRWVGVIDSLLVPQHIKSSSSGDSVEQRLNFYLNSLELLGVEPLSEEKKIELQQLIIDSPSNHSKHVCAWAEEEGLFGNSLAVLYLSAMLDLISQGRELVHQGSVNKTKINTATCFYWANETLESVEDQLSMIDDCHNISLKAASSYTYRTNHQAIINKPEMIEQLLEDVIEAAAQESKPC